jgi:hypothetical protein
VSRLRFALTSDRRPHDDTDLHSHTAPGAPGGGRTDATDDSKPAPAAGTPTMTTTTTTTETHRSTHRTTDATRVTPPTTEPSHSTAPADTGGAADAA